MLHQFMNLKLEKFNLLKFHIVDISTENNTMWKFVLEEELLSENCWVISAESVLTPWVWTWSASGVM